MYIQNSNKMAFSFFLIIFFSCFLFIISDNSIQIPFTQTHHHPQKRKNLEQLVPTNTLTSTGTTIVGLCCKDAVILGADTRSTGGNIIVDKNKLKIHFISPTIYACAAGTAADCEQIIRYASKVLNFEMIKNNFHSEQEFLSINFVLKSLKAFRPKRDSFSSVQIIGGVDREGCKLFQINSDGIPRRISFGALGSGYLDAISVLESTCNSFLPSSDACFVDINISQAIEIVKRAVKAGILNDLGSGSFIDICVISKEGTIRFPRI